MGLAGLTRKLHTKIKKRASLKVKPSSWKTCVRSLQHVNCNGSHTVTVLPNVSNHSEQGSAGFLSLAMFGTALACATAAVLSSSPQTQCAPEILPVEDELTPLYTPVFRESGMLKVSDLHTISYKVYGNPQGKPVLCVHGGPGAGTGSGKMASFFDQQVYKVVLVDQRGCGDSLPFAELEGNDTWALVEDFEKVRKHLKIDKWMIFGGSWGSTLGLAYSMTHPDRVTELLLRGIFLLRESEIQWYYQEGASHIFPDTWEIYKNAIPEDERNDFVTAYHRRLKGDLGPEEMQKAAIAWAVWEGRTSTLVPPSWKETNQAHGSDKYSLAFSRIENHYFHNKAFFPRDGWLLEKENIDKIRHIPCCIVQGRFDVVCPARSAYDLHQAFPESELKITLSGHSQFESNNRSQLVKNTDRFKYAKYMHNFH